MRSRLLLLTMAIAAAVTAVVGGARGEPRLHAQNPTLAAGPLAFETASVKPNKSGDGGVRFLGQPGGRFTATNVPLRELIRFAYQLQGFQVDGGPSWIASERFDIVAKAETDLPPTPIGTTGPMNRMMQSLLADRFKLVAHMETKELPIYTLVVARSDGRLGPQLRPAAIDCAALAAARGRGGAPPPAGPPPPGERPACGMRTGPGTMTGGGFPVSQLAVILSPFLQRVVIDRTGLTGSFDLDLQWTPDQLPPPGGGPAGAPALPPIDPNGPSLFTALQEQLGLKLDSQRGPVEVLVIDHIERPSED